MKTVNIILLLFTALAFGVRISDVTDFADGEAMNMNPRNSWVKKDVSNFYDMTKSKDDMFAYNGKRGIKGCVMVNRYEARPEWLVMTCRGEGEREPNNQGGLIVFDVSKDGTYFVMEKAGAACSGEGLNVFMGPNDMSIEECQQKCKDESTCTHVSRWEDGGCRLFSSCDFNRIQDGVETYSKQETEGSPVNNAEKPQYVNHWHGPTSVEGQAAHGNHLFTVDMEGRLQVFKNFFSTTSADSEILPTAEIQSSSRVLAHLTTWVDPSSGKLYGIATTGYSWSWPEKTCETEDNAETWRCGYADDAEVDEAYVVDYSKPDDHFDGAVIFDLSNLDHPTEVSRVCLKTKCTYGVSVFFDESNVPYGAIGGVNSAKFTLLDLSDPSDILYDVSPANKEHINHLVPFYGIHPNTPGYETFSNSGLTGGISVWNVKDPYGGAKEAAQLDELECSFANGAVFWNERYLLTPLASPVYGGACLFDMCEVNKPRFRSYVHFETLSVLAGGDARTTYGMNAYDDYAYFVLQHQNEMYTMEIDLDKVYNHVVDDNSDIEYFEVDPVYMNGYNATSCDVGEEYSEAERMNLLIIAAAVALAVSLCGALCFCYCCCCRGSAVAGKGGVQMTNMAGAGAAAAGGVVMVQHTEGCSCCCCWDKMCDIIDCCICLALVCGRD